MKASYEVKPVEDVRKPESLLNQESWMDEEAMVFTLPRDPMYEKP